MHKRAGALLTKTAQLCSCPKVLHSNVSMTLALLDATSLSLEAPFSIRLEPISLAHASALACLTAQDELWRNPYVGIPHPGSVEDYIREALNPATVNHSRTFVGRWNDDLVGSVRLFLYAPAHRRIQLGGLWIAKLYEGTGITRAFTFLIMRLVFDALKCQRLEFTAHPDNHLSRNTLARLGATYEGMMRKHLWIGNRSSGYARDSALYSLTDDDWPQCKRELSIAVERLAARHYKRHRNFQSSQA